MFIFVQPMYSKQELNADSNYVVMSQLIRGMAIVRPSWHFVMLFPDAASGYKYDDDGFFSLQNVSRIPQRVSPRKMANAVAYDPGYYDRLFREFGFDLVWCNLVEIAGHIRFAGERSFEMVARPVTVAAHNYVIHESLPYTFESMLNVALSQITGAIAADWNVFNSDYCKWMFQDTAKKWLHQTAIDDVLRRSSRINYGTLESNLMPVHSGNEVPVIAYNHRLQGYKNYKVTFELLNELYKAGIKFKVKYMNNNTERLSDIAHYPFVDVRLCKNRTEYLRELRGCDLNVTNSQHETFCISAIESMALGQPLIAPDGITFPEITGRDQIAYPYLFKSPAEQRAMLVELLTDHEKRITWGERASAFVRKEFNNILWAENYANLFEKLTGEISFTYQEDVYPHIVKTFSENYGKTISELNNAFMRIRVEGRQPYGNQALTLTKLLRLARMFGYDFVAHLGAQRLKRLGE